jgi:glycine dehydrogenase
MSGIATLSACYLYNKLNDIYPILPVGSKMNSRMHEFILTIDDETFQKIADTGTPKAQAIAKIGKLFLDFGFHAPTVAFPEQYGLMIEPTESFTKGELDKFSEVVLSILELIKSNPEVLTTSPHFTPVGKVDEIAANRTPNMRDIEISLDEIFEDKITAAMLRNYSNKKIKEVIIKAHETKKAQNM